MLNELKKSHNVPDNYASAKVAFLHPSKMQVSKMPLFIQNEFDKNVKQIFKIF